MLKKGAKKIKDEDVDMESTSETKKSDKPLWDASKLSVGDTFSGTSYFRTLSDHDDKVQTKCLGNNITVSRDVLECQMYNSQAYGKEEKLSLTKVASLLEDANTACFTVCFSTKVDEAKVKE